jgi:tRNA dimethylallyltransferase
MRTIFVVGPTASGKTNLAITLAKEFGGEVISCDSIQVYQGLDIGSSKPSILEQQGIKHHLLSTVPMGEKYTAGDFRRDALKILAETQEKIMWIVGGTGFYFKALEFGMTDNPKMDEVARKAFESEWEKKSSEYFYKELKDKDPERAKEISPNDSYRIFRAIEILRLGFKPSELKQNFRPKDFPYPILKLGVGVDRDTLRARVDSRTQSMLALGFEQEVLALRERGFVTWEPMQSVGYKEMNEYLDGRLKKSDLLPQITTKTMQLAKRQMTWFKKDPEIHWFENKDMLEIKQVVHSYLR